MNIPQKIEFSAFERRLFRRYFFKDEIVFQRNLISSQFFAIMCIKWVGAAKGGKGTWQRTKSANIQFQLKWKRLMCTFSSDRYSIDCEIVHTWDVRKVLTSVTVYFPFFLALHLMMMSEKTDVCVSVCMRVCVYMCVWVCVHSCMCICMRLCVCLRTTLLPRQQATSQTRPSTYKRICYVLFVSSWITFDLLANSMALEAGSVRGIFFPKYWCFVLFLWQASRFCLHIRVDVASQSPGGSSWLNNTATPGLQLYNSGDSLQTLSHVSR